MRSIFGVCPDICCDTPWRYGRVCKEQFANGHSLLEATNGNQRASGKGADNMDWNAKASSHENGNWGTTNDTSNEWSKNVSKHEDGAFDDAGGGAADDGKSCRK